MTPTEPPSPPQAAAGSPLLARAAAFLRSYNTEAGRQAARNLVGVSVCTVLTQLCALCSLVVLTHGLGRDDFGIFSFASNIQAYLLLFGTSGVMQVVVREGVRRPGERDALWSAFLVITAAGSSLVCLVALATIWLAPVGQGERALLTCLALGNIATSMNPRAWFEVHHRHTRAAVLILAGEFVATAALALLGLGGHLDLMTAGAVYAAKWAAVTAALYADYAAHVERPRFKFSWGEVREVLRSSWPLAAAGLVSVVPYSAGVFFVRLLSGNAETAILGLALQVANAYLIFASLGTRIVRPHVSGPYGLHAGFLRKLAAFSGAFLGVLMLLAIGGAALVIYTLLAPAYRESIAPMAVLVAGALLNAVGRTASTYLVLLRSERVLLLSNGSAAVLYVIGCLVLVPALASLGAALATLLASAAGTALILAGVRFRWPVAHPGKESEVKK